jgi:hypothetical protein
MSIRPCRPLRTAGAEPITIGMIWNEIRDHLRERLPAIIDLVLYIVFMAMVMAVLLGVVWLYVEYGMFLFLVGVGIIIICGILNERRGTVYTGSEGWPGVFGDGQPSLPPPGKNALPGPGPAQIGRSQRPALPGPKGK